MKAVIQAGGKGTRVSSITGNKIPKPMLEVEGYPIILHQMLNLKKSGITDITIITGYLGHVIKDAFGDGSKYGLNISYVEENPDMPLGTAGALYDLKDKINEDFVFLLADVFIDIDFKKMMQFHKENCADVTLLTHPNSHPFDSDLVVASTEGKVEKFDHKDNDRSKYFYHNLVNAGVMIFSPRTLDFIREPKKYSYEKDIVEPLIKEGKVYSYKSSEYAKDMGTPDRYKMVQDDFINGLPERRNLKNKQKCIFLDRDGTINELNGFIRSTKEMKLLPGVSEAIRKINDSNYLCVVVTNQPVIARGEVTIDEEEDINMKLETMLGQNGAYINGLYYCPHHPDKGFAGEIPELKIVCNCRKPAPGMVLKAAEEFNIDLTSSFIIGDSTLDIKLGENAGLKSILVKTGAAGMDGKFIVEPDAEADSLDEAVEMVLNDRIAKRGRR